MLHLRHTRDVELVPFRQFVLKLHSRCDLACDHCYVYEHEDTQWRGRPMASPRRVLEQTAVRIAEHAAAHRLSSVRVVLHGGEPLLAGPETIGFAAEQLRAALPDSCGLDLRIHTNGVLLDRRFCDLFLEHDIRVGISLDGDRAANDLHRRYADGRSSHSKVLSAVALLQEPGYRRLFAGILCTIDVRNDPLAVYEALTALDPPGIDFLLPHATWVHPPLRPDGPESTPYAAWLGAIYERWEAEGRPVPVRTFDSVLRTLHGLSSLTENLGLEPADLVVIETDGTLEQADSLRTAFDGAAGTGFNVFDHDLDRAARHPGMIDRQLGLAGLCATCRSCPVVSSCGGGLYAHRYREENGFENPSVFCGDLKEFITMVAARGEGTDPARTEPTAGTGLTDRQWDELAAGHGGTEAVRVLVGQQLEIDRTLLAHVATSASAPSASTSASWRLLTEFDVQVPDACDQVMSHPYNRTWATGRWQRGDGGDSGDGLAESAAAVALRAGSEAEVRVPLRGGVLRLPGLGRLLVDGDAAFVSVRSCEDGFTATTDSGATVRIAWAQQDPRWQPTRTVAADADWTVRLEDTDPCRDAHGHPVSARLGPEEFAAWERDLTSAWALIKRILPGYAEGIAAGLSVITPLQRPSGRRDISSSARSAFGAVGIARPATADTLALLLVHEFQHVKLGAVLDLDDLIDGNDARAFHAPWREDPRPLEGLLQGTYAHVAVTEYWRARWQDLRGRHGFGTAADRAQDEFARCLADTAQALGSLSASGSLTGLGGRFVAGMEATLRPWLDELDSDDGDSARPVASHVR
ncbi:MULTISPECIES: FxsB family cyclophane-forming radical SAM/SPASM peptide maturase [Streptacidiphilus]|uniref:FxsB family cyclophane-forming radical SAM/SPASM peptide maturase n=1 Tax=Streptacidiphilus cavernicola TaxID=3342716 RepID=A0ABV6UWZ2_9ACTN|nr:FxsB family cyclophane-forming radical SAM/SPASM peptide maturase [Streptacidiphilus jeojiense]